MYGPGDCCTIILNALTRQIEITIWARRDLNKHGRSLDILLQVNSLLFAAVDYYTYHSAGYTLLRDENVAKSIAKCAKRLNLQNRCSVLVSCYIMFILISFLFASRLAWNSDRVNARPEIWCFQIFTKIWGVWAFILETGYHPSCSTILRRRHPPCIRKWEPSPETWWQGWHESGYQHTHETSHAVSSEQGASWTCWPADANGTQLVALVTRIRWKANYKRRHGRSLHYIIRSHYRLKNMTQHELARYARSSIIMQNGFESFGRAACYNIIALLRAFPTIKWGRNIMNRGMTINSPSSTCFYQMFVVVMTMQSAGTSIPTRMTKLVSLLRGPVIHSITSCRLCVSTKYSMSLCHLMDEDTSSLAIPRLVMNTPVFHWNCLKIFGKSQSLCVLAIVVLLTNLESKNETLVGNSLLTKRISPPQALQTHCSRCPSHFQDMTRKE